MWSRRARHVTPENLLSAKRLRFVAGTKSDRGRARVLCRSAKTTVHRTRGLARNKRKRAARKARAVSNERKRTAAATALCSVREWGTHRRSHQWHAFSELELGCRNG